MRPPQPASQSPGMVEFRREDILSCPLRRGDEAKPERFDVVLCLSVTKWVHFAHGDTGIHNLFKRCFKRTRPGGYFVLEPQGWGSYKKDRIQFMGEGPGERDQRHWMMLTGDMVDAISEEELQAAGPKTGETSSWHVETQHGSLIEVEWMLYKHHVLLEAGANKDLTNNRNCTVLLWASGEGNVGIVRLLLEAVADDDVLDYSGRTAFWTAADAGHLEIVPVLLVGGASTDVADKDRRTALWGASFGGHVAIVDLLLEATAENHAADDDGRTAL
ncbi:7SK snRNA methylphosphate capping enzyme [Symbiodinium microadriaticum]|uniref:RNA methyltransferase n=1 Tax=Symbiodinium microadriaticum TaxID=2951 RepID=A0A1Q9EXX8_SYMMI|nr:7SK snRNA methylphosphate capping enzyme [Symbiodinium microadriaticum]